MLNLLKADFYRILKSKVLKVSIVLAVLIPLVLVMMSYGVSKIAESAMVDDSGVIKSMFSGRRMIASSFSLTDNFGLILPIFGAIFVSSDLKNGTLRNKIISGHNRKSIYFSHLIVTMIYNLCIIFIYSGVMALFSCLLFGYGKSVDVKELFYILIIGFVSFLFVATISTLFTLLINSTPLAIVLTIACCLGLSFICTIISVLDYEKFKGLVYFIPLFANSSMASFELSDSLFIEGFLSLIVFGALNTVLGLALFLKNDLK
ncbi:MAG: ABC transporter permease [Acholeplasmatales bacterium]|nr:ABC transporter permease [Acholeplasmatales bacterium]